MSNSNPATPIPTLHEIEKQHKLEVYLIILLIAVVIVVMGYFLGFFKGW